MSTTPATLADLTNISTDAQTFTDVVNSTASYVTTRLGATYPTLSSVISSMNANGVTSNSLIGERLASKYTSTATSNDGLKVALSTASLGSKVQLEPSYSGTDAVVEWLNQGNDFAGRSISPPLQSYVHDRRPGASGHYAYNVSNATGKASHSLGHRVDQLIPGSETTQNITTNAELMYFNGSPGSYNYGRESGGTNLRLSTIYASKGIGQTITTNSIKTGIGDFGPNYNYSQGWGGQINGDDEGHTASAHYITEGNGSGGIIPLGSVTSIGTDSAGIQFLRMNCASVNGYDRNWGAGRYASIVRHANNVDASIGTFTATANGYGSASGQTLGFQTITVTETIATSKLVSVYGICTSLDVPFNNDIPQLVTISIIIEGGTAATTGFTANSILGMAGQLRNERVKVVSVQPVSNGVQSVTLLIRNNPLGKPGTAGPAWFFQDPSSGGYGQAIGRLGLWENGLGYSNQSIPVLGALDAHTLIVASNSIQGQSGIPGFAYTQPFSAAVTITRTSNVATINSANPDALANYANNANWRIVNASDTTLNSAAFTPVYPDTTGSNVTYASTGSNITTAATATLIVGQGKNTFKLYNGVEIIRVCDPTALNDYLGKYIGLESNSITFTVGDVIDSPSHYSTHLILDSRAMRTSQPSSNSGNTGLVAVYGGPSIDGGTVANVIVNENPANMYAGMGGDLSSPSWLTLNGSWSNVFTVANGMPPGWSFLTVGNLAGSAGNSLRSSFKPFSFGTKNSSYTLLVDQTNNEVSHYLGDTIIGQKASVTVNGVTTPGHITLQGASANCSNMQLQNVKNGINPQDVVTLSQVQAMIAAAKLGS